MDAATILITGATDGIGRALAAIYQRRNVRLILTGRRDLAEIDLMPDGNRLLYFQGDLADPQTPERLMSFLDQHGIDALTTVIHNAADGWYGPCETQSAASIRRVLAVNTWAPIALTHALLGRLERGGGKLVFVGSVVSSLASPDYAVYAASKAALEGFARALRVECRDRVAVQMVVPGGTATGLHGKIGMNPQKLAGKLEPVEPVAQAIVAAIDGGKPLVAIGWKNGLARFVGRRFPGSIDALIARGRR